MSGDAKLSEGSIARHLVSQTLPMVVGITCIIGVGLVDAYFIGQLGADELAAVSFIFPVTTALTSIGVGVMVGVNSVISRTLGQGNKEKAECRTAHGILFAALIGLAVALLLFAFSDLLFTAMNASEDLRGLIRSYILPYSLGFPLMMTSMGANGALRGQGEAKKSSSILIVISLVNAALDPLLIFGWGPVPGLGIAGAGYATAGANLVGVFYGLWLVSTSELRFDPARCLTGGVVSGMAEIGKVGMPASIANAVNPAGLSGLTAIIAKHGDAAVAAFGAAGRLQAFSVVPLLALSSSIGPIVGQNWGADKVGRARDALRLSGLICVLYGLAVAVPLSIFGQTIGGWFTDDSAVIDGIAHYLLIASWAFFAYGLLIVSNGAVNAIDKSKRALGVSVARVALVMVPLGLLGSAWFGPAGVYGADLIANLLGGTAAFWLAWRSLSK